MVASFATWRLTGLDNTCKTLLRVLIFLKALPEMCLLLKTKWECECVPFLPSRLMSPGHCWTDKFVKNLLPKIMRKSTVSGPNYAEAWISCAIWQLQHNQCVTWAVRTCYRLESKRALLAALKHLDRKWHPIKMFSSSRGTSVNSHVCAATR